MFGKHRKNETAPAAQAEAQAKGDSFDARHGASVVRAADKRLVGQAPYNTDAKLADTKTGKDRPTVKGKHRRGE